MSQDQVKSADRPIKCISCGRIIGQGFIIEGAVQLLCKCGVKTKIEATIKPEGRGCERTPADVRSIRKAS